MQSQYLAIYSLLGLILSFIALAAAVEMGVSHGTRKLRKQMAELIRLQKIANSRASEGWKDVQP